MFKCSYILIFAILTLVLTACGSGAKQTEVFIYPHELISDYGRNGCGIHQQELICWGKFFGEQQPKIEHPIQVSVGSEHACVLHKDGVSCWGNNTWGQTDVPALKNPIQVKAGARHSCALERGKVVCWGESNQAKVPPLDHPKQISVAGSHNCVLDRHQVKCWDSKSSVLERVPQLRDRPSFVSAAASSACAVTLAESLVTISCWNADSSVIKRELSDPTLTPTLSLINLDGGKFCTVIDNKISCSGASPVPAELQAPVQYASRTCALDASGIVCWGESYVDELEFPPAVDAGIYLDVDDYNSCVIDRNNQIKCSQGFNFERYLPDDLSHPRELGLGYRTSCALDDNGLQCWKLINNPSRELVLLNTPVVSEPSQLNVNYESACVVDSGSVVCWGETRNDADFLASLENVSVLKIENYFSCAISNSKVVCSKEITNMPLEVEASDFAIGNGVDLCALSNGQINCWGDSALTQLTPPTLTSPSNVVIGKNHICTLDDGSVLCWGKYYPNGRRYTQLSNPHQLNIHKDTVCALDEHGVNCWPILPQEMRWSKS